MRIALVCPYDLGAPGGVQDQVFRIRRWLMRAGHDATVVGPGTTSPQDATLVGGTVTVPANASATPIAIDPRVGRRIRRAVADADVVHIHEPLMPVVSLAATRGVDAPTVGTFHADAPRWARTLLAAGGPAVRALTSRIDVMTAVSEVARSAVGPIDGVRIVPNGIDVADYVPAAKEPGSVVFVGRDDPRKGLDTLLEAWRSVVAERPHAHLSVIGADREPMPGITFRGRVSEIDKRAALGRSAIAVAPNLGGESFGIVVAEAMASGCAVVASAIPAFVHVLGDTGELVAPGDPAGLGERIVALIDDDERRRARGAAARRRVERFDGSSIAIDYLAAYDDAIARHPKRERRRR